MNPMMSGRSLLALLALAAHAAAARLQADQQVPLQHPPALAVKDQSCSQYTSYTALGDSYAAGFGSRVRLRLCNNTEQTDTDLCTFENCGKDIGAYGYQFRHDYNIPSFQYLACNGNDTDTVHNVVKAPGFGKPDLVTVNVGGDDSSFFAKIVEACVYRYNDGMCDSAIDLGNTIIRGDAENRLKPLNEKMRTLFAAISEHALSNVTVVVMSYAQFWGKVDATDCLWPSDTGSTPDQKRRMNQLAISLNRALKDAADAASFIYGDADAAFEGNRFCDRTGVHSYESWFQHLPKLGWDTANQHYTQASVFHPKIEGQQAYLSVMKKALGCD